MLFMAATLGGRLGSGLRVEVFFGAVFFAVAFALGAGFFVAVFLATVFFTGFFLVLIIHSFFSRVSGDFNRRHRNAVSFLSLFPLGG
jgi:hypothetical protein